MAEQKKDLPEPLTPKPDLPAPPAGRPRCRPARPDQVLSQVQGLVCQGWDPGAGPGDLPPFDGPGEGPRPYPEFDEEQRKMVRNILLYQGAWLTGLILLALFMVSVADAVPVPWAGIWVAIGSVGWGAAGACFSSILAVMGHYAAGSLDPGYGPWHLGKPLVGAFCGALVFLLLQAGINVVGPAQGPGPNDPVAFGTAADQGLAPPAVSEPEAEDGSVANGKVALAYALAALFGFQERVFLLKIKQLVRVLLGMLPPEPPNTIMRRRF